MEFSRGDTGRAGTVRGGNRQPNRRAAGSMCGVIILFSFLGIVAQPVAADSAILGPTPAIVQSAGLPVQIRIPAIGVDAAVEQVGLTQDGSMDVPQRWEDVGWYQLGARPGDPGNAVIAGHVDSTTGTAVFWKLHKLQAGDAIIVVGDDDIAHRFTVTTVKRYDRANAPLNEIFGPANGSHLNLITCDASSTFDPTRQEYASNWVVYADATP